MGCVRVIPMLPEGSEDRVGLRVEEGVCVRQTDRQTLDVQFCPSSLTVFLCLPLQTC